MPLFNQTEFNAFDAPGSPTSVFTAPGSGVAPTTFGELRFRVQKAVPGSDLDLIDGWIQDRYQAILDRLSWNRVERSTVIQTFAPYALGTVSLANGDTSVTLDASSPVGTAWAPQMTGCAVRFEERDEYYEFTPYSQTSGTIDRPYEGPGGAGLAYKIFATVYLLPADCREVRGLRLLEAPRPLERKSKQELNFIAANRAVTGKPRVYAPYMDFASAPPVMQVEIYPAPDRAMSVVLDYIAEQTLPGASSTALLPWMRPSALYEGTRASALDQMENYRGAELAEMKFQALVEQMVAIENRNTPPQQIKMAARFVRHRIERALWSQPRRQRL